MVLASGVGVWAIEGAVSINPYTARESDPDTSNGVRRPRCLESCGRFFTALPLTVSCGLSLCLVMILNAGPPDGRPASSVADEELCQLCQLS